MENQPLKADGKPAISDESHTPSQPLMPYRQICNQTMTRAVYQPEAEAVQTHVHLAHSRRTLVDTRTVLQLATPNGHTFNEPETDAQPDNPDLRPSCHSSLADVQPDTTDGRSYK